VILVTVCFLPASLDSAVVIVRASRAPSRQTNACNEIHHSSHNCGGDFGFCDRATGPSADPTHHQARSHHQCPVELWQRNVQQLLRCVSRTAAKGDGRAASAMKTAPTDVTALAKKSGGKYLSAHVASVIRWQSSCHLTAARICRCGDRGSPASVKGTRCPSAAENRQPGGIIETQQAK
jgi:hypothetical protein